MNYCNEKNKHYWLRRGCVMLFIKAAPSSPFCTERFAWKSLWEADWPWHKRKPCEEKVAGLILATADVSTSMHFNLSKCHRGIRFRLRWTRLLSLRQTQGTWICLWCRLVIFLVSWNLLWLSPSLSGHVQRSTAVLHCEERERRREGSFDSGVLAPCNILVAIPCVREHVEDERLYLCVVSCCRPAL